MASRSVRVDAKPQGREPGGGRWRVFEAAFVGSAQGRDLRLISDVDLVVAVPTADVGTSTRPDGLAWVLGLLIVGTVVAVDPAGLVPTGPMRWTVITVTTGLVLAVLVRRTVAIPAR